MPLYLVEKLTTTFIFAAFFFTVLLSPFASQAATCDGLFQSAENAVLGAETSKTEIEIDYHIVDAAWKSRNLRFSEIIMFGERLFLSNLELFARNLGLQTQHELQDLRVVKFRHEKIDKPFSHYRAEIAFEQNGQAYEVSLFFRSNGELSFLEGDIVANLPDGTRVLAIAHQEDGQTLTFNQADLADTLAGNAAAVANLGLEPKEKSVSKAKADLEPKAKRPAAMTASKRSSAKKSTQQSSSETDD